MRRREEPASGPEEFFHLGGHDGVFRGVKWKGGGKRNFKSATKPSSADSEVIYGAHILSYVRHLAGIVLDSNSSHNVQRQIPGNMSW